MTLLNPNRRTVLEMACLSVLAVGAGISAQALALSAGMQAGEDKPFEYINAQVERLEWWYGTWRVTETHFDARGKAVATVKGVERIEWLLGRTAIRREYSTETDTAVFRAFGILTWNDVEKKYDGVWFDNASTSGPTTVKGDWNENERTMTFTVRSLGPDGAPLRHRVVERLEGEQKRIATTYLIDGKNRIKRMEVEYKRAQSCPGRFLRVFDD
jgi:hypothetical protein